MKCFSIDFFKKGIIFSESFFNIYLRLTIVIIVLAVCVVS